MSRYWSCLALFGCLLFAPMSQAQPLPPPNNSADSQPAVACHAVDIRSDANGLLHAAAVDSFFLPRQSYICAAPLIRRAFTRPFAAERTRYQRSSAGGFAPVRADGETPSAHRGLQMPAAPASARLPPRPSVPSVRR
jgi:hypothetical protein